MNSKKTGASISFLFVMFFILSLPASLWSENVLKGENKEEVLGRVVVTSDRIYQSNYKSRLTTSVVDSDDIEEKHFSSFSEILESTPGFSKVYDYHSPFILRGTSGTKMLILRNGNPVFSSFPGGFMGQSVNVYDLSRLEVVRGPGSVVYGSGATSGVINIIDRDPFDDERDFALKAGILYGTNANDRTALVGGNFKSEHLAFRVSGRYRKADEFHYANWEKARNSDIEDRDISFNGGFKLNDKHRVLIRTALHRGGPWGKAYLFNQKERMTARNEDDNLLDLSARYEGKSILLFDTVNFSAFFGRETREYHKQRRNSTLEKVNSEDITDFKNIFFGANALATVKAGMHHVSLGADSYSVKLWAPVKTNDYYYGTYSKKDGAQGAGINSGGLYAQNNITISRSFALTAGARFDIATIMQGDTESGAGVTENRSALSGNVGMIFNPAREQALSVNFGRAFRMPSAVAMFNEQVTCGGTIVANPDLEPEFSWNIDAGYRGEIKSFEWDLALFLNQYTDLILKGVNPEDSSEQMMKNENKSRIYGGELEASYLLEDVIVRGLRIKPGLVAAYCVGSFFGDSENQWNLSDNGKNLAGIPPANIKPYVRLTYLSPQDYVFHFQLECDGWLNKTRLPEVASEATWSNEDINGYVLLNVTTGITFFDYAGLGSIKFNIAVNNLLDEKYHPFGSHILGKGVDGRFFISLVY